MDALSHSEIDGNAELFGLVSFVKTNPEPFRALNEDEVWRWCRMKIVSGNIIRTG